MGTIRKIKRNIKILTILLQTIYYKFPLFNRLVIKKLAAIQLKDRKLNLSRVFKYNRLFRKSFML